MPANVSLGQQLRNVLASGHREPAAPIASPPGGEPKDWTVLAYMEGRDRLSHSVEVALNGMEEIGSTDRVNLVAQATMVPELGDRRFQHTGQVNTRRYFVQRDEAPETITSPVVQELPGQERLTPQSLEDFLVWGIEKFPAKKFAVILKKHGLGFAANGSSVPLSARELRQTLENVEKRTHVKPDVLGWDACNMGQWEVAYELKDRAAVMTGSPEAVPAVEFPYPTLLHNLARYPEEQNAATLGQTIVHAYQADAPQTTQFAVDLAKTAEAGQALRQFVDAVLEAGVPRERLYTDLMRSASFEPKESLHLAYNFRDLGGFLRRVAEDGAIDAPAVKQAAEKALEALAAARIDANVDPEKAHLKGLGEDTGLSAFLPWKRASAPLHDSYSQLAWAQDTGWDRLLDYTLDGPAALPQPGPSLSPLKLGLYAYKKYVSPYLLTDCPYDTTCSQYARIALEQHGPWEGSKLAFMRLISCQDGAHGRADEVPGAPPAEAAGPLPELTLQPPPAVEKSDTRKRVEQTLFRLAGRAGWAVGGALSGLVGGVAGAALGATWGARAGGGTLDAFNEGVRARYGDEKTASLQHLQDRVTGPARWAHKHLGKVAGFAVGAASGALMGLAGGAFFSARFFGGFVGLAAQNKAKESLGELPVHYQTAQILQRDYSTK